MRRHLLMGGVCVLLGAACEDANKRPYPSETTPRQAKAKAVAANSLQSHQVHGIDVYVTQVGWLTPGARANVAVKTSQPLGAVAAYDVSFRTLDGKTLPVSRQFPAVSQDDLPTEEWNVPTTGAALNFDVVVKRKPSVAFADAKVALKLPKLGAKPVADERVADKGTLKIIAFEAVRQAGEHVEVRVEFEALPKGPTPDLAEPLTPFDTFEFWPVVNKQCNLRKVWPVHAECRLQVARDAESLNLGVLFAPTVADMIGVVEVRNLPVGGG